MIDRTRFEMKNSYEVKYLNHVSADAHGLTQAPFNAPCVQTMTDAV